MTTEEHSKELDRRFEELQYLKKPRIPEMEPKVPSKGAWAAAREEITALEKEQRRRLDAQTPVVHWVRVFDEDVPENVMSDFATANRAKERLAAVGITWKESYTSRDCERMVADPESPGGWCLDFGSVTSLVIEVQETDAQRARQVLAEKESPQAESPAPIELEFGPLAFPSQESWIAAREEITALEKQIGAGSRADSDATPPPSKPSEPSVKAWRNYDGEDGWDAE
jgi:hypothetical protein